MNSPIAVAGSPIRTYTVAPTRIVWQSETGVAHAEQLLQPKPGQAVLSRSTPATVLTSTADQRAGILLDFGTELHGYVELFTPLTSNQKNLRRVRIRFGESVSEAMAELGDPRNAGNDHAVRDQVVELPWLGKKMVGPSGFRFVRIDNVNANHPVELTEVHAVLQLREIPYRGSFRCNDKRLNRIWEVGAWTVHLNMQEYLWDGIKRDRLVWLGDMHPEVSTINAVFGFNDVVPRSLDLIRDITPPTEWMNGISSYSAWWIIILEDWYMHHGDLAYLSQQQAYMSQLLRHLATFVDADGRETLDGMRFIDWPTKADPKAVHEGLQAMLILAMHSGQRLMTTLGDDATAQICRATIDQLQQHHPETSGRKSPAALLALAGARDAMDVADLLKHDGPRDLSTFYGFYVLQALARANNHSAAIDFIRTYWGAMLDFGATTFWEDFDLDWTKDAARIDELVPAGKKDLHGDFGAHCYKGFRHSLCHGWDSGPTAWLSQHVLGIQPLDPGFTRTRVAPHLPCLNWAEGTYPTPQGPIRVRHERQHDGSIRSAIDAPNDVEIIRA